MHNVSRLSAHSFNFIVKFPIKFLDGGVLSQNFYQFFAEIAKVAH